MEVLTLRAMLFELLKPNITHQTRETFRGILKQVAHILRPDLVHTDRDYFLSFNFRESPDVVNFKSANHPAAVLMPVVFGHDLLNTPYNEAVMKAMKISADVDQGHVAKLAALRKQINELEVQVEHTQRLIAISLTARG